MVKLGVLFEQCGFIKVDKNTYEKACILIEIQKNEAIVSFFENEAILISIVFKYDNYLIMEIPQILDNLINCKPQYDYIELIDKFVKFLHWYNNQYI